MPSTSILEAWLLAEIQRAGLPEPVREFRFHSKRRWRFDFCWPEQRIAAECDGGSWIYGRHNRPAGFARDLEKMNHAMLSGWKVLRFTTEMIADGRALQMLRAALKMPVSE